MGDDVKKAGRKLNLITLATDAASKVGKKVEQPLRTGASAARRTAAEDIQRQTQMEKLRNQETESDIKKKQALTAGGKGGRRSLIASKPSGLSTNLGGTA
jgi:hypothetical protein